jgi:hypothetical protein
VSRIVLAALLLAVASMARAEDDEQLLETPPAQGMPERLQELEREWADDIGTKDAGADADAERPEPAPLDEAHEAAQGTESPEPEPSPPPHAEEPPAPRKSSPVLESPIRRATPERPVVRGTPPPAPKEGETEAPAKAPAHRATTPEE